MKKSRVPGKSASAVATQKRRAVTAGKKTAARSAGKGKEAAAPGPGDAAFAPIAAAFRGGRDISEARMFGSSGLKTDGRVFVMVVKGNLVVKLPAPRIQELIGSRVAQPFDPGHGKVMKEWASIPVTHSTKWLALAQEAHRFVSGAAQ
ncbi:MAG TPA: TfoX/Sxy family protein [Steroidobacteraceae bacterium]|nr:TfoX/Sxy family protein [Steroidobacteraceae bacterium]